MTTRRRGLAPLTRRRLYDTGAALLGVLIVWGLLDAETAAQVLEAFDKVLGVALLVYAGRKVDMVEAQTD